MSSVRQAPYQLLPVKQGKIVFFQLRRGGQLEDFAVLR